MSTGQLVEDLYLYDRKRNLTPQEREAIVVFALPFEECSYSEPELRAMDDEGLISAAYWVMAEYASGQV